MRSGLAHVSALGLVLGMALHLFPLTARAQTDALAAGGAVSCRISAATGAAKCVGSTAHGQLGPMGAQGALPLAGGVLALEVGPRHACAVLEGGDVVCYGENPAGQLGTTPLGATVVVNANLHVLAPPPALSVAVGSAQSCSVGLQAGDIWCWGDNSGGAVGIPGHLPSDGPGVVHFGGGEALAAAAGSAHTCMVTASNTVQCWGSNQYGQLGLGHTTTIGDDEEPLANVSTVSTGGSVTALALGASHSCALMADGKVVCWGLNSDGQLGYGHNETLGDDEAPASAGFVALGGTAASIVAGAKHTCALLTDGEVVCWGSNDFGQLGYPNITTVGKEEEPVAVGAVAVGAVALGLMAGDYHTCALVATGVVCWGLNDEGQLGHPVSQENIGDDETPASVGLSPQFAALFPSPSASPSAFPTPSATPTPSASFNPNPLPRAEADQVTTGESHSCAVRYDGDLVCWGSGNFGKLGYGNTVTIGDDETPRGVGRVDVNGWIEQASAGGQHTCALTRDGQVACWGYGSDGQLGYRTTDDVGDDEFPSSMGFVSFGADVFVTQVATGMSHSCALDSDGRVFCWGLNADGQLGLGHSVTKTEPEGFAYLGGLGATQVTAGNFHTCALRTDKALICWGRNTYGQLGYGDTFNVGVSETPGEMSPVNVGGPVLQVDAGADHTCAVIESDHSVVCWGRGHYGRLGYGNTDNVGDDEQPGDVGAVDIGGRALQVSAGGEHSCAVREDGKLLCWGFGLYGRLGYGNTFRVGDDETPASVGTVDVGSNSVVAVSAGGEHTCALLDSGRFVCFGHALYGQLGYGTIEDVGDNEMPDYYGGVDVGARSTPTPTPTPSVSPTPSVTPSPSSSPSSSVSPSASATPSPSTIIVVPPEPFELTVEAGIGIGVAAGVVGALLIVGSYVLWQKKCVKPRSRKFSSPVPTPADPAAAASAAEEPVPEVSEGDSPAEAVEAAPADGSEVVAVEENAADAAAAPEAAAAAAAVTPETTTAAAAAAAATAAVVPGSPGTQSADVVPTMDESVVETIPNTSTTDMVLEMMSPPRVAVKGTDA